jgi:hypothetical protein
MEWQSQLITIYLSVCRAWNKGVCETVRRYSNNNKFALTDEEVITIYLFGIMSGATTVRGIYDYTDRHLRDWFPNLGGYEALNYRLNRVSDSFIAIVQELVETSEIISTGKSWAVDSLPVIMAGPKRSSRARVATDIADKGFCASKDLYFYGVKIHCVGQLKPGTIPMPSFIGLAPASANDHRMFEQISHEILNGKAFGDKAYADSDHKAKLEQLQNVQLLTPIKKVKGLFSFAGSDTFSTWISSIRQPIESLFNWIQEKTKLQNASKVRSTPGLIVHIFGRFAAAILLLTLKP